MNLWRFVFFEDEFLASFNDLYLFSLIDCSSLHYSSISLNYSTFHHKLSFVSFWFSLCSILIPFQTLNIDLQSLHYFGKHKIRPCVKISPTCVLWFNQQPLVCFHLVCQLLNSFSSQISTCLWINNKAFDDFDLRDVYRFWLLACSRVLICRNISLETLSLRILLKKFPVFHCNRVTLNKIFRHKRMGTQFFTFF